MTNSEARQILIDYNAWRMGGAKVPFFIKVDKAKVDKAIDAAIVALGDYKKGVDYQTGYFDGKRSKSSIAQAIRSAAVNWPQFLGDVESQIMEAFCKHSFEHSEFSDDLFFGATNKKYDARTFMLLVAEALES